MLTPQLVRDALRTVSDPTSGSDIVSSGMISDIAIQGSTVSLAIEVPAGQSAGAEPVRQAAERAVAKLDGVSRATIVLTNPEPGLQAKPAPKKEVTDPFMMDGHKLFWHLDRLAAFQRGERIAPRGTMVRDELNIGAPFGFDGAARVRTYASGSGTPAASQAAVPPSTLITSLRPAAASFSQAF